VCSSGAELLRRLPDFSPDLIIIDVMMPDMAGPEVLTRVRQVPGFSETPVIFLTGVINGNELKNLRDSGAADVILKPFDPMTLADRIDGIWDSTDD
jgi:CheY-like chemotaxis protein